MYRPSHILSSYGRGLLLSLLLVIASHPAPARAVTAGLPSRAVDVMVKVIRTVISEAAKTSEFRALDPKRQYVAVLEALKMLGFEIPAETYELGQDQVKASDLAVLVLTATDKGRRLRVLKNCAKFIQLATGENLAPLLDGLPAGPAVPAGDGARWTGPASDSGGTDEGGPPPGRRPSSRKRSGDVDGRAGRDVGKVDDLREDLVRKLIKSSDRLLQAIDVGEMPASIF